MICNWIRLKNMCPFNIKDLCDIGWNLQMKIDSIKKDNNFENIFSIRPELDRMISLFLGMIPNANGKNNIDKGFELDFWESYSRILGNLDEKEREIKTIGNIKIDVAFQLYLSNAESILVGSIYDPIRISSILYPKDEERFLLKTYELVKKLVRVYGGESRFRLTKKRKPMEITEEFSQSNQIPPLTVEEMISDKGKKMFREKYEKAFPSFEGIMETGEKDGMAG